MLLSVFVIGPMVTQFSLGRYLAADGTWTYLQNILLVTRYELPGVFTGNIYPVWSTVRCGRCRWKC